MIIKMKIDREGSLRWHMSHRSVALECLEKVPSHSSFASQRDAGAILKLQQPWKDRCYDIIQMHAVTNDMNIVT